MPIRGNELPLNVSICYLPPYLESADFESFTSLSQKNILERTNSDLFTLVGKFNIPEINWCTSMDNAIRSVSDSKKGCNRKEMISLCNFTNLNDLNNQNKRILDLVLPNVVGGVRVEEAYIYIYKRHDRHHPSLLISLY